jgi:hypothetical protein
MINFILRFTLLIFIFIQTIVSHGQSTENRIDSIISLKKYIEQNCNSKTFCIIEIDGISPVVTVRKYICGIPVKTIKQSYGGTFAETDIYKDTTLISLRIWTRTYQNSKKESSTMSFVEYIYDKGDLCYFYEINKHEKKGMADKVILVTEFFFYNNELIKKAITGNLREDEDKYINDFISRSKVLYNEKNDWLKKRREELR